jgi:hypothetical protein
MWTLAVDAVTAEVVTALDAAGVESLLLKGPSIARWLYRDPADRPYVDSDLLVEPVRLGAAQEVLRRRGFRPEFGPLPHVGMESAPSYPWRRGRFVVDLHETLPGATADPERTWSVLRAGRAKQPVGRREVAVLGEPARLVHIALHAAHHGPRVPQPLEDLRRALELVHRDRWHEAVALATAMGASEPFVAGIAMLPQGRAVGARLGLVDDLAAVGELEWRRTPVAAGIMRLEAAPGLAAKLATLRDELFPSPEFMRWWNPLARRSRRGLAAAYAWRWAYLLRQVPAALRALRRG